MNTCWKWDLIFFGVNGSAPGSWNTIVTMSLPMCLFLRSCNKMENIIPCYYWQLYQGHCLGGNTEKTCIRQLPLGVTNQLLNTGWPFSGTSRGGASRPPLTFRPNWGPKGQKNFGGRSTPPPLFLRVWMTTPPPKPLSQGLDLALTFWYGHWQVTNNWFWCSYYICITCINFYLISSWQLVRAKGVFQVNCSCWLHPDKHNTCCLLLGVQGKSVETWNIISRPWNCVYTEYSPVESSAK